MFSERNSEALEASDNPEYGDVGQDDLDAWVGESALVQCGVGKYGNEGWIRYNRHAGRADCIYADGHVENVGWSQERFDQCPDHRAQSPLPNAPQKAAF